jgi:peptidoglycan/LPS O-acetylase OafA/YrhL
VHLAVFIAVALGVGAVSFQLVETPALAWRRRVLTTKGARSRLAKPADPGATTFSKPFPL